MTEATSSSGGPTDQLKPPLPPAAGQAAPPVKPKIEGSTLIPPKTSSPGFTLSDVALEAKADLFSELEALKLRLHEVELALASLAGPTLSQDAHDGLGFLIKWWKGFEARFAAARKAHGISGGGA